MADIIAGVAGFIALVLGILFLKERSQNKKTKSLLNDVVKTSASMLKDKAENDMAEKFTVSSQPVKQDIHALERAKEKVSKVAESSVLQSPKETEPVAGDSAASPVLSVKSSPLPDDILADIKGIAERSAARVKAADADKEE